MQLRNEIDQLEQAELAELEHKKKILSSVAAKKQELQHTVNIVSLQLKEKDQEEKLSDLKAKELKRQMPHGQLKPLRRNQSQSERNAKRNNSMVKASSTNNSMANARNASASRIPTIRKGKPKNAGKLRMNVSVDAAPQTDSEKTRKKNARKTQLLASSDEDLPTENTVQYKSAAAKEVTPEEVRRSLGYKGYTPTGANAAKAPLPPRDADAKHVRDSAGD